MALKRGQTPLLGGMLSVALSVGSRPPGVTWHSALRSPDFPPPMHPQVNRERSPDRLGAKPTRQRPPGQGPILSTARRGHRLVKRPGKNAIVTPLFFSTRTPSAHAPDQPAQNTGNQRPALRQRLATPGAPAGAGTDRYLGAIPEVAGSRLPVCLRR